MWSDDDDYKDEHSTQAELRAFWKSRQEEMQAKTLRNTNVTENRQRRHGSQGALRGSQGAHRGRRQTNRGLEDDNQQANGQCTLFIGNLGPKTCELEMEDLFGRYGHISRIFVLRQQAMKDTTYGFITFDEISNARRAIEGLNGQEYRGKRIRVTYSKKPLQPEEVERIERDKKQYRTKLNQNKRQDERHMTSFLDTYACLKSLQPEDSANLPDLGTLLQHMKRHSNSLVRDQLDDDYSVNLHLANMQKSIVSSLAANLDETLDISHGYTSESTQSTATPQFQHSIADSETEGNRFEANAQCNKIDVTSYSDMNGVDDGSAQEKVVKSSMPFGRGRGALAAALGIELPPTVGQGTI